MKTTNKLKTRAYRTFDLSCLILGDPELTRTLCDNYENLSRHKRGLVRRWVELKLKRDEWQHTTNKVSFFVILTLKTFLVLTVGIVLVLASLSGTMQGPLALACSAIVVAVFGYFRNL